MHDHEHQELFACFAKQHWQDPDFLFAMQVACECPLLACQGLQTPLALSYALCMPACTQNHYIGLAETHHADNGQLHSPRDMFNVHLSNCCSRPAA